jgi:hypothetical protein
MTASARIRCGYNGHMWPDELYTVVKTNRYPGLKEVWECRQRCVRDGCERERIELCVPYTMVRINRRYLGRIERIGRLSREQYRKEIIADQNTLEGTNDREQKPRLHAVAP